MDARKEAQRDGHWKGLCPSLILTRVTAAFVDCTIDCTKGERLTGMKYREIVERTRAVAARPVRGLEPAKRAARMDEFTRRTGGSARLFEKAGKVLPRGSGHAWTPHLPYPLFMDHGKGSRVWDVDGNEYLDYVLAGGPLILGHNHEGLRRSMLDLISKRTNFHGFHDEMELKAAEKIIHHFPGIERVRFTSSGTEANAAAARIARSFTGKRRSPSTSPAITGGPTSS